VFRTQVDQAFCGSLKVLFFELWWARNCSTCAFSSPGGHPSTTFRLSVPSPNSLGCQSSGIARNFEGDGSLWFLDGLGAFFATGGWHFLPPVVADFATGAFFATGADFATGWTT
jgi:hypothetical protein